MKCHTHESEIMNFGCCMELQYHLGITCMYMYRHKMKVFTNMRSVFDCIPLKEERAKQWFQIWIFKTVKLLKAYK